MCLADTHLIVFFLFRPMEPSGSTSGKWAREAQAKDRPTDEPRLSRQQHALQDHDRDQSAQGQCDDDDDDDDLCIWAEEDGIRYAHLRLDTGDDLKMPVVSYDF